MKAKVTTEEDREKVGSGKVRKDGGRDVAFEPAMGHAFIGLHPPPPSPPPLTTVSSE